VCDGIVIDSYDLQPHVVRFTTHWQEGFIGTCTYVLRGRRGEERPANGSLSLLQQLVLLGWFAFYTGVGYKTAMGMGQTRWIKGPAPIKRR
jgi:CRISPR-associated endoribonuclease Cas6